MVHGPGKGVERKHRPADHVHVHLHIDAFPEERNLLGPAEPPCQEPVLHLAFRLAKHGDQGEDDGENRSAGHGIDRGPVEPVVGQPGKLEGPHDQHDEKDQHAVQAVVAGFSGFRVDDVAGHPPAGKQELDHEKHGVDDQRGEESQDRFRPGQFEKVFDTQPFDHDRIPLSQLVCGCFMLVGIILRRKENDENE